MMFHKQYYKLEEAAQKLEVDVETLFAMEARRNVRFYVRFLGIKDGTLKYVDFSAINNYFRDELSLIAESMPQKCACNFNYENELGLALEKSLTEALLDIPLENKDIKRIREKS
jgi:hypothetical protein